MIELRKADKDEALRDVKSAKSANCGEGFSKLQKMYILLVTGHWVKFSEKLYIYNIIHLGAINQKNQSFFGRTEEAIDGNWSPPHKIAFQCNSPSRFV
jgi:hypothetical protein